MLQFSDSHSIVTRSSRVSRAPPYPTLPALLNLHDSLKFSKLPEAFAVSVLGHHLIREKE